MSNICEVFNSIQGEGREIGLPMTFIRFNKCNKRCPFCDTDFKTMARDHEKRYLKNVLFTGGEPFLFSDDIFDIIRVHHDKIFFGETNGSIFNERLARAVNWAISPKDVLDIPSALELKKINGKSYYKLVFGSEGFDEMFSALREHTDNIYIQPMTIGSKFLDLQKTMAFCMDNDLPISPRLHILWGLK